MLSNLPPGVTPSMIPGYDDIEIEYDARAYIHTRIDYEDITTHNLTDNNLIINHCIHEASKYIDISPIYSTFIIDEVIPDDYYLFHFEVIIKGNTLIDPHTDHDTILEIIIEDINNNTKHVTDITIEDIDDISYK